MAKRLVAFLLVCILSVGVLFAQNLELNGKTVNVKDPADGRVMMKKGSDINSLYDSTYKSKAVKVVVGATIEDFLKAESTKSNRVAVGWADNNSSNCLYLAYGKTTKTYYFICTKSASTIVFDADASSMFRLSAMQSISFNVKIDSSAATTIQNMFCGATSLKSLDISDWDLSHVVNMSGFCWQDNALTSVKLPNGLKGIHSAVPGETLEAWSSFYGTAITEIDLSGMPINNKCDMYDFFFNCTKLKTIKVSADFDSSSLPYSSKDNQMFSNCTSLKNYSKDNIKPSDCTRYFTKVDPVATVSAALSLDGTISVYFDCECTGFLPKSMYIEYPDYLTNLTTAESIKINDTDLSDNVQNYKYRYNAKVAAAQMTKDMTFTVGDNVATAKTTVRTIVEQMISAYATDTKLVDLCKSVLAYGSYAQQYFDVATDNLADKNCKTTLDTTIGKGHVDFTGLVSSPEYHYNGGSKITGAQAMEATAAEEFGARFLGNSLVCYSELCTRQSFAFASGLSWNNFSISVKDSNGNDLVASGRAKPDSYEVDGETRYYVEINGFAAPLIGDSYTLTLTNKSTKKTFSVTYSPMVYINGAIQKAISRVDDPEGLQKLCASIYWYYKKAVTYFGK